MRTCDKRIKNKNQLTQHWEQWVCGKPVYKGTFCRKHWFKRLTKIIPYGKRENYREPTLNEMKSGKTIYLKTKPSYGGHRYRGGFIFNGGITPTSQPTNIAADPSLFVIKIHH